MADDQLSKESGNQTSARSEPQVGERPATAPEGRVSIDGSRLNFSFDLQPGARLRLSVESLPAAEELSEGGEPQIVLMEDDRLSETSKERHMPVDVTGKPLVFDISANTGTKMRLSAATGGKQMIARLRSWVNSWPYTLEITLFGLALSIYVLTRLCSLSAFPIYFFSDEAVQTVLAIDLLRENFHNQDGEFLPTYFNNVDKYSLSTTVYLQILPYLFFGKSVFVTRATSVVLSLLAAISVALILRDIFKLPYWWGAVLLLSITPAWFLHSRTAFETVTMTALYGVALYCYLLYRYRSPRYLFLALVFFALAFYSYSPGRVIVVVTGFFLLLSDISYHWRNRRSVLIGSAILVILALPYFRFMKAHPTASVDQLATLGSYWLKPLPFQEKLLQYGREYLYGLSPGYWFIPNQRDLPRHLMKDYGHLLRVSLPFCALGMLISLRNIRSSSYRALIIAFLAAPTGAAMAQIAVTRALVMVIPATLLAALGLVNVLTWLERKKISRKVLTFALCALLGGANIIITWDALTNGPTWYRDYGLAGMQYGGRQVYAAVEDYLQRGPKTEVFVSPTWANGADVVARFFLGDPLPVKLASITGYMTHLQTLDRDMLFVMTNEEYQSTLDSGKFAGIQVEQTIPFPDGRPGFYFVRLEYVEDIEAILSAEREIRRQLQQVAFTLDGQEVIARHSMLDIGRIADLWDGNARTVARTLEANPFIIELTFSTPRPISGLSFIIGDTEVAITARLYPVKDAEPFEFESRLTGTVEQREVTLDFVNTLTTKILYLEVEDLRQSDPGHVHIWEIGFR